LHVRAGCLKVDIRPSKRSNAGSLTDGFGRIRARYRT
jgi:hypothetical protein